MKPKNVKSSEKLSVLIKARLILLNTFPAVLFCSYYPLIPIAASSGTNLELSLPLIWLFLFSVLSLKDFAIAIYNIYKKTPIYLTAFLFPLYLSASAIWSLNPLRAILTAGIFWCIIITSIVIFTKFYQKHILDWRKLLKSFFFSSLAACAVCWLQAILDVASVGRETTLLCNGCTSYMFGFPHPSGFAIEPQFMGNLLLAPTLTALFFWAKPTPDRSFPFSKRSLFLLSLFFSATLFLTFSRGAIFAFLLGFAILFLFNLFKLKNTCFWKTLPLLIASAIVVILMQGVFSSLSPTNSTFLGGVEKSISQMTLGKINLSLEPKDQGQTDDSEATAPIFDGYVEESTNVRLNLNQTAIELASKSPTTSAFGYGLGSAGKIMFDEGKTTSAFEIVQNEPLSLLLETGMIGLLLALFSLVATLRLIAKRFPLHEQVYLFSLIFSFAFSLLFFSGLPNALHLYLFPVFLSAILLTYRQSRTHEKQLSSQNF